MATPHLPSANAANPLIACPECDLLQRETALPVGEALTCRRCGAVLYKNASEDLERTLAGRAAISPNPYVPWSRHAKNLLQQE